MRRSGLIVLALCLAAPYSAAAQEGEEQEPPRGLFISSWICPQSVVGDIAQAYDSITRPIEEELVAEGKMVGAGLYFHNWADEWNVNYYRLGQDRTSLFEAIEEVGRRTQERHPDASNPFESCSAHKDGIYFWGPRTAPAPPPAGQQN
jgi:hypothetical protein